MRRGLVLAALAAALLYWWGALPFAPSTAAIDPSLEPGSGENQPAAGFRSAQATPDGDLAALNSRGDSGATLPGVDGSKRTAAADSGQLEVIVLTAEDRAPISAAVVTVNSLRSQERAEFLTDEAGRAVAPVGPGEYAVSVEREGFSRHSARLGVPAGGGPVRREIVLLPMAGVEGVVVDENGEGVSAARVQFFMRGESGRRGFNASVETDGDGFFRTDVTPGTYRVRASKSPHPRSQLDDVVVGPDGRDPIQLTMKLRDDVVVLSGTVVDDAGDPIADSRVRVRYRRSGRWRTLANARSGANGRFSIEMLPRSNLELSAGSNGYRSDRRRQLSVRSDTDVGELQLRAYPAFEVRVVDMHQTPVDDARVHGVDSRNRSVLSRRADGRYAVTGYPVRIYADALHRGLGVSAEVVLESHQPSVDLILQPGAHLKGRVVAADEGAPVKSFVVSVRLPGIRGLSRRVYAEDGAFDLRDLPAGEAVVTISASGFERIRRDVSLTEAAPSWLEVVMEKRRRRGRGAGLPEAIQFLRLPDLGGGM